MEFIWKKGVGLTIAVAPRSIFIVSVIVLGSVLPDHLPRLSSILVEAFLH